MPAATASRRPARFTPAILCVAAIALTIAVYVGVQRRDAPLRSAEDAVKEFSAGRRDTLSLDLTHLSPAQRQTVLELPLTQRIGVGDVATPETCAATPVVI